MKFFVQVVVATSFLFSCAPADRVLSVSGELEYASGETPEGCTIELRQKSRSPKTRAMQSRFEEGFTVSPLDSSFSLVFACEMPSAATCILALELQKGRDYMEQPLELGTIVLEPGEGYSCRQL